MQLLDDADAALTAFASFVDAAPSVFMRASNALADVGARMPRFVARAREPDSDKQVYGAAMAAKVLAAAERYDALVVRADALRARAEIGASEEAARVSALATASAASAAAADAQRVEAARAEALRAQVEADASAALRAAAEAAAADAAAKLRQEAEAREEARATARAAAAAAAEAKAAAAARAAAVADAEAASAALARARGVRADATVAAAALRASFTHAGAASATRSAVPGAVTAVKNSAHFTSLIASLPRGTLLVCAFVTSWCAASRAFAPIFSAAAARAPTTFFLSVDADAVADFAARARVRDFPSLAFYVGGGDGKPTGAAISLAAKLTAAEIDALIAAELAK